MTDEPRDGLQFEKAEYAAAPPQETRCAACGQQIWDSYYEINGKVACERCKSELELRQASASGAGRFLRAAIYGTGAGALGAGIWYAVEATTGYQIGFIAIVVGLLVGGAVKKGTGGRGGRLYQALAVFLTYASIVSTYIPTIIQVARKDHETRPAGAAASPPAASAAPASAAPASTTPAAAAPKPAAPQKVSFVMFLIGIAALFALAFALPFLMGFQNIVGLFIIGIGLYEAWKITAPTPFTVSGPYRVGAASVPGA